MRCRAVGEVDAGASVAVIQPAIEEPDENADDDSELAGADLLNEDFDDEPHARSAARRNDSPDSDDAAANRPT